MHSMYQESCAAYLRDERLLKNGIESNTLVIKFFRKRSISMCIFAGDILVVFVFQKRNKKTSIQGRLRKLAKSGQVFFLKKKKKSCLKGRLGDGGEFSFLTCFFVRVWGGYRGAGIVGRLQVPLLKLASASASIWSMFVST